MKTIFVYKPTIIYLHVCDSLQDIETQNFNYYSESDANSIGTLEYKILQNDESIFNLIIPVNHPDEEDLNFDEIEGKILVREIKVYREQKINVLFEKGASFQPQFVFCGLAYSFDGVFFDSGDGEMDDDELQEYEPLENETEETYFEYYEIKNGIPILLEA